MRITVLSLLMLGRHWRVIVVFLATIAALLSSVGAPAFAENDRIALVIGNSRYFHFRSLPNADNDARLLHKALTGMGFDAGAGALTDLTKLRCPSSGFFGLRGPFCNGVSGSVSV